MNTGQCLQLAGGVLEGLGIGMVALGISEARRKFTDRAHLIIRGINAVARQAFRVAARFQKPKTIHGEINSTLPAFGTLITARVTQRDFTGTLEERVEKLQKAVQLHDDELRSIGKQITAERDERIAALDLEVGERAEGESRLDERIREAATGGLSLQTWGVTLLLLGVFFATWGNLIQ